MPFKFRIGLICLFLLILIGLPYMVKADFLGQESVQTSDDVKLTIMGRVTNTQDTPLSEAEVEVTTENGERLVSIDQENVVFHTDSHGFFIAEFLIPLAALETETLRIEISKPGFRSTHQSITRQNIACSDDHCYSRITDIALDNIFTPGFYVATITFIVVFVLIALQIMHDTITAFLGATVMLGVSYILGGMDPDYWILSFEQAIDYIDFDVIFLILTLMIVVSIIGRTGVFQWLALSAYRAARGSAWRLAVILMLATAVLSALLNNVTIMLLMAPITIEITLMLEINPAALLIPEVMASNIGGVATLIGDPPNTVIGSFAGIGFNQFLIHMGPIAIIATCTLIVFVYFVYNQDYANARETPSSALLERLEQDAQITDPVTLKRSILVLALMIALFLTGEYFQMPPSVAGLIGATILLVWVQPDVDDMLREVDWTTLVFFMSLFIVVGGVQEMGLIQWIAEQVANAAGDNPSFASQVVIWLSAVASAIVNNIPFTAAALPIAAFLTQSIPSISNNILYWSLSLGANLGGNATYIGSAPNVVAVGILDRAGYRVTFIDWLKIGIPATIVTVSASSIWIWIRYFWLKF